MRSACSHDMHILAVAGTRHGIGGTEKGGAWCARGFTHGYVVCMYSVHPHKVGTPNPLSDPPPPTASVSSALLGSLLLGTTVSLFLARLLQVAHTAARSECHSSVPYHDADFAAMLSRIPSTTNTLTATDEHEPMLVEPRSTSSVHPGSLLVVHPNGVVPLDGTVVWGSAAVEYATQGKRTRRIVCEKGTAVLAGSVVREAVLVVQVSCMAHDTRAAQSAGYVVVDGPFCVGVEGGLSVA